MAASWKRVVLQGDNITTVQLVATEVTATLSDSFVVADADDGNLIKRDSIADVIGLVAGTNTATGLKDTSGVLSVDMSLGSETPVTDDLVLVWDDTNNHFYTSTVANIGAAGENTTYNVQTSGPSSGVVNIDLTGSDDSTDSVSITGDSGVFVSQATDQITIDIPDATDAASGLFRAQLSHTSLASPTAAVAGKVLGRMGTGGVVNDLIVRDEDDFANADATSLATTESIKAYVDAQVTAQDLDLTTDSGSIAIDLDSETFTIAGTANEIETSASGSTITIGIVTNPTLTGDVIITGDLDVQGTTTFLDTTNVQTIDKVFRLAVADVAGNDYANAAAAVTASTGSGLEVVTDTIANSANFAKMTWVNSQGSVTGWSVRNTGSGSATHGIAVLDKGASDPTTTPNAGALFYNSGTTSGTAGLWVYSE